MTVELEFWLKTLINYDKPRSIIFLNKADGVGDKLNSTPAIREYKKLHPDHEIIVVTTINNGILYKNNPHIDFLLPVNIVNPASWPGAPFKKNSTIVPLEWSYEEQHNYGHVCSSYMFYLTGSDYETKDHTMELYYTNHDINVVNSIMTELYEHSRLKKEKPIIAIAPAFTKYERTLSKEYWIKATNILEKKYNIVSLGHKRDFDLTKSNSNIIDLRDKLSFHQIVYFLNFCEKIYLVQSGMLHIAGCNPNIEINLLNVGAFPPEMHYPYRNGQFGFNCNVIWHDCIMKEKCFKGHISSDPNGEFIKKYNYNLDKYKKKNYPDKLIQQYTSHTWCIMKEHKDRYMCSKLVGDQFIKQLEQEMN
jgi:hypothetical protein